MKWFSYAMLAVAGILISAMSGTARAHDGHNEEHLSGVVASIIEEDIEYGPEEQIVHIGQPIRIENKDPFNHKSRVTLQKKGGGLGHIALKDHIDKPGKSYTFKLDKPGIYEIRCLLHDGMTATIKAIE